MDLKIEFFKLTYYFFCLRSNSFKIIILTFDTILYLYRVEVEGDEHDIKKAEEIAASIKSNPQSRRYAMLENDDEERNLDEETHFTKSNYSNSNYQSGIYQPSRYFENGNQRLQQNVMFNFIYF